MHNATDESVVASAQRLRLRRFGMSVATYMVAILATFLITLIGIGDLNTAQWVTLVGLCLLGIGVLFLMFYTKMNLRFSEPSLTREQIVYSSLYGVVLLHWLPEARPIILLFFLPPFSFGMLSLTLRQYLVAEVCVLGLYGGLLGFEYIQDRQAYDFQYQLFLFGLFSLVLTWFAFFGGFVSKIRRRLRAQKQETSRALDEITIEVEARKRAQVEKDNLIVELQAALSEVNTLSGLIPICASCKNIRDDQGYWNQIETFIQSHSEAKFSHGICPDCSARLYPELVDE